MTGAHESVDPVTQPATQWAGRYDILRAVGAGASGRVFQARDAKRQFLVALKLWARPVTAAEAADPRAWFRNEALAGAALAHPDIAATHAWGLVERTPWLAQEWVPGHDLSRYVRPQRLLPDRLVLRIAARLAMALAHAHGAGVVHRDLKPSNVRIHLPANLVKLTDFGVARLDDGSQTATGLMLGTPAYMAPEQLAGHGASPASDIYALGVLSFELLSGRRPHEASTLGELLRQVAADPAAPLSRFRPDLPPELGAVLAQVLAPEPEARPKSAQDLAQALGEIEARLAGSATSS